MSLGVLSDDIDILLRADRLDYPSYPGSEILDHPVNPYQGRRHTHEQVRTVSASQSRYSSFGSSSLTTPEPEKHATEDNVKKSDEDIEDRRPSFAEIQGEDLVRRPSVTVYQLEDSDHPDIKSIQDLVANMNI